MQGYKPTGYPAVSPYLLVVSVEQTLAFLNAVFSATVLNKLQLADGSIKHAEVRIDDAVVMLGERPDGRAAMLSSIHVYVPDVDATYQAALLAGAVSVAEPKDQPYGDRSAGVRDAEGNLWWLGTRLSQ